MLTHDSKTEYLNVKNKYYIVCKNIIKSRLSNQRVSRNHTTQCYLISIHTKQCKTDITYTTLNHPWKSTIRSFTHHYHKKISNWKWKLQSLNFCFWKLYFKYREQNKIKLNMNSKTGASTVINIYLALDRDDHKPHILLS